MSFSPTLISPLKSSSDSLLVPRDQLVRNEQNAVSAPITTTIRHRPMFYCNPLSLEEIDKLLPSEHSSIDVHQVNSENIKSKLKGFHYNHATLSALITCLKTQNSI